MKRVSVRATTSSHSTTATQTRLSGRWLWLARAVWLSVATVSINSFLLTLPLNFTEAEQVCSGSACDLTSLRPEHLPVLAAWGLSPAAYAAYGTALGGLEHLAWIAMGVLLFIRGSAEPRALFFSFVLVLFGGGPNDALATVLPIWWLLVAASDFLTYACLFVFLYVFPTGQFVPRWTRWVALLLIMLNVPTYFFPDSPLHPSTVPVAVVALFLLGWLGSVIVAQVYRYRWRSTHLERQQTKWVLLALGLFLLLDAVRTFDLGGEAPPLWLVFVFATAYVLAALLIPLTIAASILRYRLWEVDRLINKVLVYGTLTGLLGALYAGLIIGLESLAGRIAGPAATNPVILVLSTLAIFALSLPLRRRIQQLIDRRFYRRKYDAEQTLAAFSASLRQEVDLEHIREQLLAVVQETMQPEHVSLWLTQPASRPQGWQPRASGMLAPAPTPLHVGRAPDTRQQAEEAGHR